MGEGGLTSDSKWGGGLTSDSKWGGWGAENTYFLITLFSFPPASPSPRALSVKTAIVVSLLLFIITSILLQY